VGCVGTPQVGGADGNILGWGKRQTGRRHRDHLSLQPRPTADPAEAQLVEGHLALIKILGPPSEPYRRHLAAGIERLDLAAELAEAVDLQHRGIDRALLEALERFQLAFLDAEQRTEAVDRKFFARLEFKVAALLHHLVERERVFAAEGEHHLLLQARIL